VKLLTFVFVEVLVTFPPVRFPGMELQTLNRVFSLTPQSVISLKWGKLRGRIDFKNIIFCQKNKRKYSVVVNNRISGCYSYIGLYKERKQEY